MVLNGHTAQKKKKPYSFVLPPKFSGIFSRGERNSYDENKQVSIPNEVKYALMASARPAAYEDGSLTWSIFQQGAGRLWIPEAVFGDYEDDDYEDDEGAANGEANAGIIPGEIYAGPVVYQDGAFRLVDENGNPIAEAGAYSWAGSTDWEPLPDGVWQSAYSWAVSYSWAGGYNWAGSYSWSGLLPDQ